MKKYITLALTATVSSLVMIACGSGDKKTEQASQADSLEVVQVERSRVSVDTVDMGESFTATLEAKVKNNISAQAGGRLQQLLVKVGDRVGQGQVVARLEATQLATAQIQLNDAKLAVTRMSELYKIGGVSKAQLEQAESALAIAQQQVNNLATNTALRSPISGVVTAKNYDSGDMTSPSLPVVVIEQISPVKANVHVSEAYYTQLRKGLSASLSVEALGEGTFDGYISNVYPTIDSKTHTVQVEVEFANKDMLLRPGMYGSLKLDLGRRAALVVPDKAVQRMLGAGKRYVYVVQSGKAVYREVEVGEKFGDKQEILSGLELGEEVVTSGAQKLKNGQPLR
ncbi:MAG: efflux RND transporter periplasmic adaptor subunit [Porphyromonas sp.]|nr:efflux RND transporter periplasmic adaptor subunit [Porphyromonas sp.]